MKPNLQQTDPVSLIPRTSSELELTEEMAMAEYRERVMYRRLVSGMQERAQLRRHDQQLDQAMVIPQLQVRPQPQPQPQQPLREAGSSLISRQQHAEVLSQALRITSDSAQLLDDEAATESMSRAAREAFVVSSSAGPFASAGAAPEPPRPRSIHRNPQDGDFKEEGHPAEQQKRARQKLLDVLEKVANEDWSIEGYNNNSNYNYGYGIGDENNSQHVGRRARARFALPVYRPSSSVPTCWDQTNGMVFNKDL